MKLRDLLIESQIYSYRKCGSFRWCFVDGDQNQVIVELDEKFDKDHDYFELETYYPTNSGSKTYWNKTSRENIGRRGKTVELIFEKEIIPLFKKSDIGFIALFPIDTKRYDFFKNMLAKYSRKNYRIIEDDGYKLTIQKLEK